MPLEIASFNLPSAILATTTTPPPSRIELCQDASSDGLTPTLSTFQSLQNHIQSLSNKVNIPIHVMIRPHARDFIYTAPEIEEMKNDITLFRDAGVDGFVFGCFAHDEQEGGGMRIDREACSKLIACISSSSSSSSSAQQQTRKKKLTFHRAFDSISPENMSSELETLIDLGFDAVLTSGGAPSAMEGVDVLRELVERARGRIEIIVGGGVRSWNVEGLREGTGARWFHSSAVIDGSSEMADEEEVRKLGELVDR